MNLLWAIVLLVLLAAIYLFAGNILTGLAEENKFVTIVKEGTLKWRFKGGKLAETFLEFQGHVFVDTDKWHGGKIRKIRGSEVRKPKDTLFERLLFDQFGVHWLGPLPDVDVVHTIKMPRSRIRIKPPNEGESSVVGRIEYDEGLDEVDHLRCLFTRSFEFIEVETKGGQHHINILVSVQIKVHHPYFFILLEEKVFQYLADVLSDRVNRFVKAVSYDEFSDLALVGGHNFVDTLKAVNRNARIDVSQIVTPAANQGPVGSTPSQVPQTGKVGGQVGRGLINSLGIEILDVTLTSHELSKASQEYKDALAKKDTAEAEGKAVLIAAQYAEKAKKRTAKGDAAEQIELISALNTAKSDAVLTTVQILHGNQKLPKGLTHLTTLGSTPATYSVNAPDNTTPPPIPNTHTTNNPNAPGSNRNKNNQNNNWKKRPVI